MKKDNLLALAHSTNDEEISSKNKGFNLNNKLMDLLAKRTKAYTMGGEHLDYYRKSARTL